MGNRGCIFETDHDEALTDQEGGKVSQEWSSHLLDEEAMGDTVTYGQKQLIHTMSCRQRKRVCCLLIRGGTVSPPGSLWEYADPTVLLLLYTSSSSLINF